MMNSKPLWIFFMTSVWLLLGLFLYQGIFNVIYYEELLKINPAGEALGGYFMKAILGPFIIFGMEFTFWYKFFRYPTDGARVFAAFVGIAVLLMIFIKALVADMVAPGKETAVQWLYWYIGLGHIFFSLFGKD